MCIAVPGKLISIEGDRGQVDIRGNVLPVELGLVRAVVGDYLLIHAGCAIAVVSGDEAAEMSALFDLVESYDA